MASQPIMAVMLVGLGVRQLSVAPRSVPLVKRIVRGISVEQATRAAAAALSAATAAEAEAELRQHFTGVDDGLFADAVPA
jgi:signal transduction protein with GAF and PtsI domain